MSHFGRLGFSPKRHALYMARPVLSELLTSSKAHLQFFPAHRLMIIALHPNARTTPVGRDEIAASGDSLAVRAARYGVDQGIIRRWNSRQVFHDPLHSAHRLQTTLMPAQKAIVVQLRKMRFLPLDDLLALCREVIFAGVSCSGLDRCLRSHGVGSLKALLPATPRQPDKSFGACESGYVNVQYLPQMAGESTRSRSYLFVDIGRTPAACSCRSRAIHTHRFAGGQRMRLAGKGCLHLSDHKLPLSALHSRVPMQAIKAWHDEKSELSHRQPRESNRPGWDA